MVSYTIPITHHKLKKAKVNDMNAMTKQSILYRTLCRALSVKRPHKGQGEALLLDWLFDHLPDALKDRATADAAGNLHIDARVHEDNRTLFVAHVDTVHREDGPNKFIKAHTMWYAKDAPLGADDGAGVAMLMHLIYANMPAYYIFTVGEECGGIGARSVSTDTELLAQFDRAIAFDRRGIDSVITHQGYGRCCSDEFAQALSDALNAEETLMYLPDNTGVYTDTAEFVDTIPECTNISVGYASEHSPNESLDIMHYRALAERVVNIDWDGLPTKRDPSAYESMWAGAWGAETTSVSSFSTYDSYSSREYFEYDHAEEVREALYEALVGDLEYLVDLMCESVYPEDPDFARRFISKKELTHEVVSDALRQLSTYDSETILAELFNVAHCEA